MIRSSSTTRHQRPRARVIQDGTISFAVYGTIAEAGGSSHVRLDLADGDTFNLEVLVPDRDPENTLDDFSHLTITTTAPDGSSTELQGDGVIDRFDEPFTNTSYLRLIEFEAPAVAGTYELTVTSSRPTRFTVATGTEGAVRNRGGELPARVVGRGRGLVRHATTGPRPRADDRSGSHDHPASDHNASDHHAPTEHARVRVGASVDGTAGSSGRGRRRADHSSIGIEGQLDPGAGRRRRARRRGGGRRLVDRPKAQRRRRQLTVVDRHGRWSLRGPRGLTARSRC